jgi:flagellar motor switch protein FliM
MKALDQVLSQDEVDALLNAVDRGELPDGREAGHTPAGKTILRYNFRKPNRISKDQVKMLHSIHESFARLYSASLTTLLRGLVEIEMKSVEQATYGEFLMSLAPPTCLVIFDMDPLKGAAAMEINANVLFRVIDRLLGGSGLMPVKLREFTEVEQVLIERTAIRAMVDLQQSWQHAGTFAFRVAHLETNPQFVQLTAPNEVVIVVTFDVRLGEESGQMTVAYPHLLLEPVMPRLNTHRYFAQSPRAASPQEDQGLRDNLVKLRLGVRAVLAEVPISVRRLLELAPGDVLPLGRPATAPAVIEFEGVGRFTGRPGTVHRHRAVKVLGEIPKGELTRDAGDRSRTARIHG